MNELEDDKIKYLLEQRTRNTFDLARTLRKFNKHYIRRNMIPLNKDEYTDLFSDELVKIFYISKSILAVIEGEPLKEINLQQLEFKFLKENNDDN